MVRSYLVYQILNDLNTAQLCTLMSEFKLAIPKKYSKKELIKMIMNASSQVGGGLAENTNTTRIGKNVVIIGGGPVGLMTAILMKRVLPNLNYTIIEKYPEFVREQILVIDKNSYNLIPNNVKQSIWGQQKLGCYIHSPSKDLLGRCYTDQYSLPFASVSINILQETLALSAKALGIQIIKPTKQQGKIIIDISPQHVSYRFETDEIKTDIPYDFLIGADGVNSLIREKILQAKYPVDPTYKAYAGVFILYFKKGFPNLYSERPLPERGAKQNRIRWFLTQYRTAYIGLSLTEQEFYETKNRLIKNREDLPDKLRYILDTYIDFFGYHPDELDLIKTNTFEISLNKATKNIEWINNKMVAIVGDASFNIHFFSGSGLNLGIRSAVSLVENFEIWMRGLQDNNQFIKEYENDVSANAKIAREKSFESTLDVSTLTKKCNRYTLSNLKQLARSKQLNPKNLSKEELCFLFLNEVPLEQDDDSKLEEWLANYDQN